MRSTLLALGLILCTFVSFSKTYYISTLSGNDNFSGRRADSAWKTISKLNAMFSSLQPGDSILFKRGETFNGGIKVTKSGSLGLPIVISAYGSGANPIINAAKQLTTFSQSGSIYTSVSITAESNPLIFCVDDNIVQMGRFPNPDQTGTGISPGGWLTSESSTTTSITDNNWSSIVKPQTNWFGTQIVYRLNDFRFSKGTITSNTTSGGTHTFPSSGSAPLTGYGYFFQNALSTLDQNTEWFYDKAANTMKIFLSAAPGTRKFEVPVFDAGILADGFRNLTFENLNIKNANRYGISMDDSCTNIDISNCVIKNSGIAAVYIWKGGNINISGSVLQNAQNGVKLILANDVSVINSFIDSCGLNVGMGDSGVVAGVGINYDRGDGLIQGNTINHTSYANISFSRTSSSTACGSTFKQVIVQNNICKNALLRLADGGGIYTVNSALANNTVCTYTDNSIIKNNIVSEAYGNLAGTNRTSGYTAAYGIYMDNDTRNITADSNVVYNCEGGIYLHRAGYSTLTNNTTYNIPKKHLFLNGDETTSTQRISNLSVTGNILYSLLSGSASTTDGGQGILYTSEANLNQTLQYGFFNYNIYGQPFAPTATFFRVGDPDSYTQYQTLANWKTNYQKDSASTTGIPKPSLTTSVNDILFAVNETGSTLNYPLNGFFYTGVDGKKYAGTVALNPYSAKILLKDTAVTVSLEAVADATVRDGSTSPTNFQNTNYGSDSILLLKNGVVSGYNRYTYLKFSLKDVPDISTAKLRFFVRTKDTTRFLVNAYGVNTHSWVENTITYANAPAADASPISGVSVVEGNRFYDIDISNYVKSETDTLLSIMIKSVDSTGAILNINSKESAANHPQLIIVRPKTIIPLADAYVRSGTYATINYGSDTSLIVKNNSTAGFDRKTYLKFVVTDTANIGKARLRIYGNCDVTSLNMSAFGVDSDSWTESGINYNNAPAASTSFLDATDVGTQKKYYELDVTSYVKSQLQNDSVISFLLKNNNVSNSTPVLTFNSKEGSSNLPKLLIDLDSSALNLNSKLRNNNPSDVLTFTMPGQTIREKTKPNVFPNPFNRSLSLVLPANYKGVYAINLVDGAGRAVSLGKIDTDKEGRRINYDLSKFNLPKGQMYLRIIGIESLETISIQKQ